MRNDAGLNQRQVAERLGRSRSFISKVETYELRLDIVQLADWLRAIGADELEFLTEALAAISGDRRKRR
jgi:transcriptional regulator with XRE-family HTH domain